MDNILVILPTDRLGGAERVAQNFVDFSLSQNCRVFVYVLSRGKSGKWDVLERKNNCTIYYSSASREFFGIHRLIIWLMTHRNISFDIVYSTHLHVNSLVGLLRRFGVIKCAKHIARESTVIFDRFTGFKRLIFRLLYKFYNNVDLLICQTNYMKIRLLESVPSLMYQRVAVVPNPLNISNIQDSLANSKIKYDKESYTVLFVGRLIDIKNPKLCLSAIAQLSEASKRKIKCIVLGDGELLISLKEFCVEKNISSRVEFLGNVDNPYEYMRVADLGIVTSIKEGFPNVILEMMASGTRNIITTNCAGDLNNLPSVTVLEKNDEIHLSEIIEDSILSSTDNSPVYLEYVRSRDISLYYKAVVGCSLGCLE